jgi:superfamily II DNA or RNA helicase/SOS-response transcriptional repressor LexA
VGSRLKAYIFARLSDGELVEGTAFVGSSNISRQALQEGLEWNYRVVYPADRGFLEARTRFEEIFSHARTVALSDAWIESYEKRRVPPPRSVAPGSHEQEAPPEPTEIQQAALAALHETRQQGFRRGVVVLATGLGKTWLAAFDAAQVNARRVLFVAHREEILAQAAATFVRIRPRARVGYYMGRSRDAEVDVLCASVQTLGRAEHLERFAPQHFDYVVIDEFHHAAAATYRRLLGHFAPAFLLGLTATPDRTDQSDILSLCDDNLVFTRNLFEGIQAKLLSPFHYYGILDESVDYREVPWRNGRFDPEELSNKLATLARARHAIREWRSRAQKRTLAFCVSIRHAEYMASQFQKAGIASAAVYAGSALGRAQALEQLRDGQLSVVFSVDLFNEGVDLPGIDTVMMLRPTESKILFLQQLGRGLRLSVEKEHLVVLDFIGNHQSFLQKPQALFGVGATYKALAAFARKAEHGRLELPDGCYVNYDLKIIEFLKSLDSAGTQKDYEALRASLGRRPTLAEFYRSGASVQAMRQQHGSWFDLVETMGDLQENEVRALKVLGGLPREVEVTPMTKSFKMVLLEAWLELNGLITPPTLAALAQRSWDVLHRRPSLLGDLPEAIVKLSDGHEAAWIRYWRDNPINAWIGGNRAAAASAFFRVEGDRFSLAQQLPADEAEAAEGLLQELAAYRLATYEVRRPVETEASNVIRFTPKQRAEVELPYFPNLKIACGHFRAGRTDAEEHRTLPAAYGKLDATRHFIARASGNSMDGGKNPIRDGDYLQLELVSPSNAGSITGTVMAIERQDEAGGDNQYLLRVVTKTKDGGYVLKANNPAYDDLQATDEMRTLARLQAVVDPLDLVVGQPFAREDIPPLFGETFNPGSWNVGHVVLNDKKVHVLLVTLNKQGKAQEHRYHDHWIDEHTFHWQSQNATTPASKRGQGCTRQARSVRSNPCSWTPVSSLTGGYWAASKKMVSLAQRVRSASNYEFDKKKSAYFTKGGVSAFALTTQVLQHPTWTVDVMQHRQDAMLSKLEHHWRLEERKSPADIAGALLAEIGQAGENVVFELESARHGLTALARESGTLFTVMAGSMAKTSWSGQPHSYEQLRLDLQSNGSLKPSADGPWLVFTQDVAFKSPSAASATVLGRTDNGRNTWRMKGTSITYGAWQDNLPSGKPATGVVETDTSQP